MNKEAMLRLEAYLKRRKEVSGLDIEHIHGFDLGTDTGTELLLSDIESLIAKVESLTADAGRLDWLAENSAYVGVNPYSRTCLWTLRNIFEIEGKSFRESIDAAKEKA